MLLICYQNFIGGFYLKWIDETEYPITMGTIQMAMLRHSYLCIYVADFGPFKKNEMFVFNVLDGICLMVALYDDKI